VGETVEQAVVGYVVFESLILTVQSVADLQFTYPTGLLVNETSQFLDDAQTI
jgi:hypothetical protein